MSDYQFDSEVLEYIATHSMGTGGWQDNGWRMAKKLMLELVKSGHADFLLLRDDDIGKWWGEMVRQAQTAIDQRREKLRIYEIKKAAWEKLSPEHRRVLGLRKPIQPKG
jgi:hypothetical protein